MRSVRAAAILIFAFLLAAPADAKKAPATISETVSEYVDAEGEDVFAAKIEAIQKIIAKDMKEGLVFRESLPNPRYPGSSRLVAAVISQSYCHGIMARLPPSKEGHHEVDIPST